MTASNSSLVTGGFFLFLINAHHRGFVDLPLTETQWSFPLSTGARIQQLNSLWKSKLLTALVCRCFGARDPIAWVLILQLPCARCVILAAKLLNLGEPLFSHKQNGNDKDARFWRYEIKPMHAKKQVFSKGWWLLLLLYNFNKNSRDDMLWLDWSIVVHACSLINVSFCLLWSFYSFMHFTDTYLGLCDKQGTGARVER